MVLDIREVEALKEKIRQPGVDKGAGTGTHDVRLWCDGPVLVASLRESLDDVGLVAHEAEETHDLFAAGTNSGEIDIVNKQEGPRTKEGAPSQHVALLCLLQDEDKLVDAVDLVLDVLDERPKRVRDVVDKSVRNPV